MTKSQGHVVITPCTFRYAAEYGWSAAATEITGDGSEPTEMRLAIEMRAVQTQTQTHDDILVYTADPDAVSAGVALYASKSRKTPLLFHMLFWTVTTTYYPI